MNSVSLSRRSQTPERALIPAHGKEEGSVIVTLTVLPTANSSTFPTVTQLRGLLRNSGAITKPTTGTARIAVQTPARDRQSFSKNPRRLSAAGWSTCGEYFGGDDSAVVFMA